MGKVKELKAEQKLRQQINKAASTYLCDQEDGDLYDAYLKLLKASEDGDDDYLASNYITVWQNLEGSMTVAAMIALIEDTIESPELPEFLTKVDWTALKGQKKSLLAAIEHAESTGNNEYCDDLNGILNLIDSIQDYAVDDCGLAEDLVFDLHPEE